MRLLTVLFDSDRWRMQNIRTDCICIHRIKLETKTMRNAETEKIKTENESLNFVVDKGELEINPLHPWDAYKVDESFTENPFQLKVPGIPKKVTRLYSSSVFCTTNSL